MTWKQLKTKNLHMTFQVLKNVIKKDEVNFFGLFLVSYFLKNGMLKSVLVDLEWSI